MYNGKTQYRCTHIFWVFIICQPNTACKISFAVIWPFKTEWHVSSPHIYILINEKKPKSPMKKKMRTCYSFLKLYLSWNKKSDKICITMMQIKFQKRKTSYVYNIIMKLIWSALFTRIEFQKKGLSFANTRISLTYLICIGFYKVPCVIWWCLDN